MPDQNFSPQDSLRIIHTMIEKTKQNIFDQSHYFLLWGWGAFIACIGQYILKVYFNYPHHYLVWLITFLCLPIMVIFLVRDAKKEKVRTYAGDNMGYLWTGLGISFFVLSMIFVKFGWQYCYPFFILLYGIGTFVSGQILRFVPLIAGGVVSFILAAVSVWFNTDLQMLFAAAALLFSYIIPGHLLQMNYKKQG
jgi:hypothetical protein